MGLISRVSSRTYRCNMAETKNIDWRSGDISAEANLEVGSDQNKESSSSNDSKDEINVQKTEEITTTISETENSKPETDTEEKLRSVSGETDVSADPELEQIKQRVREM